MKRISWILMLSISLITGTVAGLYLYHQTDSNLTFQVSKNKVRSINETLHSMLKKDPQTLLKINQIITASPYLREQKKAFLIKYYGHKSTAEIAQAKRLLRMYAVTQKNKIARKR